MPPALSTFLSIPIIWIVKKSSSPGFAEAQVAGLLFGFVMYDLSHCNLFLILDFFHHANPPFYYLKKLKAYHLEHHYKNSNKGFGVTSKFWDIVFGTEIVK
jgi:sterol desaturase/sphingolipid hydroxylase (fatty acid hydroxylase superfamily)